MASGHWENRYGKSYLFVFENGKKPNGERNRITESVELKSDQEADDYLADKLYEMRHNIYIEPNKKAFGEYLEEWLEIRKPRLSDLTYVSYKQVINNHIKKELGNISLQQLCSMDLQRYYAKMESEGRINGKITKKGKKKKYVPTEQSPGLSQRTVNYHHRIISMALKQAKKWNLITANPALDVDIPTFKKKKMQVLFRREMEVFLDQIKDSEYYQIVFTAIMSGLREGELLGLRWQDIDLQRGLINVRQQQQYTKEKGWHYSPPKSDKSIRTVPMQLPLNKMFRKIKKEQEVYCQIEEQKLIDSHTSKQSEDLSEQDYKTIYDDKDLIFCRKNGDIVRNTILSREFKKLAKKFGLPDLRFHDLRHTFATLSLSAGIAMDKLQSLLGHESISTTIDMYSHIDLEALTEEMKKLSNYLGFDTLAE